MEQMPFDDHISITTGPNTTCIDDAYYDTESETWVLDAAGGCGFGAGHMFI